MKKYELTNETIYYFGRTLHRIKRLSDGELGGFIEKESNLSHEGHCWIAGNAKVFDNAKVYGNAWVSGNALVRSNAQVFDNAGVFDDARVAGNAKVFDNASVCDNANVLDNASVYGNAHLYDNAQVFGKAKVFGSVSIYGNVQLFDNVKVQKTPVCISGLTHHITITETHIFIGCEGHTIQHWKKEIINIGKKNDYTKEEIIKVINHLRVHFGRKKFLEKIPS